MKGFCKNILIGLALFLLSVSVAAEENDDDRTYVTALGFYEMEFYRAALKLLQPLADAGHAKAQLRIGYMYSRGEGVEKNIAEAVKWYEKSAEQGYDLAQLILGAMYQQGTGVEKDSAKSFKWFSLAAEQGNADAQHNLAYMYQEGIGTEKDYAKAFDWYFKAATQGKAESQFNLATLYAKGQGTHQSLVDAYAWTYIAARSGLEEPGLMLDKIKNDAGTDPLTVVMGEERASELLQQFNLENMQTQSQ